MGRYVASVGMMTRSFMVLKSMLVPATKALQIYYRSRDKLDAILLQW